VLNKNTTEPDVLLAITTSQLDFYQNGNLENLIFRISAGSYCFVKDTIVDLYRVHEQTVQTLKTMAGDGFMAFHGELSQDDFEIVRQKIITSRVIERKFRNRIL
jgi:cephalosporin hydroxylase